MNMRQVDQVKTIFGRTLSARNALIQRKHMYPTYSPFLSSIVFDKVAPASETSIPTVLALVSVITTKPHHQSRHATLTHPLTMIIIITANTITINIPGSHHRLHVIYRPPTTYHQPTTGKEMSLHSHGATIPSLGSGSISISDGAWTRRGLSSTPPLLRLLFPP